MAEHRSVYKFYRGARCEAGSKTVGFAFTGRSGYKFYRGARCEAGSKTLKEFYGYSYRSVYKFYRGARCEILSRATLCADCTLIGRV